MATQATRASVGHEYSDELHAYLYDEVPCGLYERCERYSGVTYDSDTVSGIMKYEDHDGHSDTLMGSFKEHRNDELYITV